MAKPKWTGDHLWRLLNLPMSELKRFYPDYSVGSLKGKKQYWKKQLMEGKINMPPHPEGAPQTDTGYDEDLLSPFGLDKLPPDSTVSYHVGYIRNAEGEIEYTKPLPSIHPNKKAGQAIEDFISQADPVRITPSKRKPPTRDYRTIVAFGDSQIDYRLIDGEYVPLHDERALGIVRLMCRDLQPDVIVNLGDTVDLAALSRFPADSDHFNHSMTPSFNRVHRMYAELRADNPQTEIVEVDSNHNTRLAKFVLKHAMPLYGVRQAGSDSAYPVLTYPFFANLEAVNVKWVSGYGAAEYVYGDQYNTPPIVFKHGTTVVSSGSTAAKESKENPETHVVRGHGHKMQEHWRTNRAGQYLASIMVGTTCRIDGVVPSYHSAVDDLGKPVKNQEDWQQSLLVIEDYQGNYQFNHVPIRNGRAFYGGKEYGVDE